MRPPASRFRAIVLLALVALGADQTPKTIHLGGNAIKPSDWSAADLKKKLADDLKPIDFTTRGAKHTFHCVPLLSILKAGGAPTDFVMQAGANPAAKNAPLRLAVVVKGRDGYAVLFSLAEILPSVGGRTVWAALDEDGSAIPDSDGPVRLIAPDDKMPARGVHQVASIELMDLSAPDTQPAP